MGPIVDLSPCDAGEFAYDDDTREGESHGVHDRRERADAAVARGLAARRIAPDPGPVAPAALARDRLARRWTVLRGRTAYRRAPRRTRPDRLLHRRARGVYQQGLAPQPQADASHCSRVERVGLRVPGHRDLVRSRDSRGVRRDQPGDGGSRGEPRFRRRHRVPDGNVPVQQRRCRRGRVVAASGRLRAGRSDDQARRVVRN